MKIGFLGLLGIAFIVLKLTSVIDWSWWLVTMPLWLPTAAYLLFYLIALLATYLWGLYLKVKYPQQFEEMRKRRKHAENQHSQKDCVRCKRNKNNY